LYTCLKNMLYNNLIEEVPLSPEEAMTLNVPRKYYQLTQKGKDFLFDEIRRFHKIMELFYRDKS